MPATLEKIESYKIAFDNLCRAGEAPVIKNTLLLCRHLLSAEYVFAFCYDTSAVIALHGEELLITQINAPNFYTPFLFNQYGQIILPSAENGQPLQAEYHLAGLPLIDANGNAYGKVGWIDTSLTAFANLQPAALQLAVNQLSNIIATAAENLTTLQQLQYYFDNSPLAIIEWDSQLKVAQWSSKAEALFGWKKEEVFGLSFNEFNIVHPEAKATLDAMVMQALLDESETVVIENKNYTKSGEELFCRWHNSVKRKEDGSIQSVFVMVENITSLKLANKILEHNEEQLEENKTALSNINSLNKAIIAALPDLMFRLTKNGTFADYYVADNDNFLFLLQPEDFIGKNAADILPASIVKLMQNAFASIDAGQRIAMFNYELALNDEQGEFEGRVTRINQDEYLCVVRDITDAKKAERQIIYKNELLDAVAQIGILLLGNEQWHSVFQKSLGIIGNAFHVSRVYFFEVKNNDSTTELLVTIMYEWLNEGFASQINNEAFNNIKFNDNPEFWNHLQSNKIFAAVKNNLREGHLKNILSQLENKSLIVLPLVINDVLLGVIVLDECNYERLWTREEKATLRIISNTLITSYEADQIQRNIKKVNELFGYVMKATNDLIWDWDMERDIIERSENGFKNVTGFDYEEVQQTVEFWPSRVHPIDKEPMLLNFTSALNNPDVYFWENNFRFLKKDGSYSYLADRCYIIRNERGKAIRAIGATQDITEQRKAINELANSEQRFRSMVQNISDIITLISEDGTIIYQTASAKRILGFDDGDIVGKSFFRLLHPDDVEKVAMSFNKLLQREGDGPPVQLRYLTKDGTYTFLEAVGNNQLNNPAINAIIVISRDVTERIKAGEAIRASEEKFRSLVHNISDIISIISPAGQILYQSSSVKQKMGYGENELSNRSIGEIVHPEDFPALMGAFGKLIERGGTSDPMEFRILNKDGSYFYIEAQATNQIGNPTIGGIVITSRDISQRKKTEEERKLLIEELTKNNADLTQFSYIVSHDLRAPLTNLISMIKLLDFGTIQNPRSLKLLEGFKISTFKLRDTLNDLTDVLLVKNNTNVEMKTLSFKDVFAAVQQSISSIIEKSQVSIIADFTDAPLVKFSEPYLESIFQNLLTNSIRYASSERLPQINISTSDKGDHILLSFSDNGIGFNMNVVKDKIFRLHQRFHHHPESRGIGLYLIHSQITSLGGSIAVESEENAGTTFTITLKK